VLLADETCERACAFVEYSVRLHESNNTSQSSEFVLSKYVPLGHKVSETNSMGTTKGDASVDTWRIARRLNAVDDRERRDNIVTGVGVMYRMMRKLEFMVLMITVFCGGWFWLSFIFIKKYHLLILRFFCSLLLRALAC
jgi:hypothetical protein